MDEMCVTKSEAGKLLGVGNRQVEKYLHSGRFTVHHIEKGKVMIPIEEIYDLREEKTKRKRGK